MGIRRYYKKYRVCFGINNRVFQVYVGSREEADRILEVAEELKKLKRSPWAINSSKKSNARHQDLPVGWCDTVSRKVSASGVTVYYPTIRCTFKVNGRMISPCVQYGIKRTREEAIVILLQRTLKRLKEETKKGP